MAKDIRVRILIYFLLAIASLFMGFRLDNKTSPDLALVPKIDRQQAIETARAFLDRYGFAYENFSEYAFYKFDNSGSNYIISRRGIEGFRALVEADSIPFSQWSVEYYKNVPKNKEEELFMVLVSATGHLNGFMHRLPDSTSMLSASEEEALQKANAFLEKWPGIDATQFTRDRVNSQNFSRSHYDVVYVRSGPKLAAGEEKIFITVSGDRVTSFRHIFSEPQSANVGAVEGPNLLFNALSILAYLIVSILALVLFLKRYHEGEIGVSTALWAGLIVYVALIVMVILLWDGWADGVGFGTVSRIYTKWILLGVQMIISYVYLFVNSFTAWAVGDYEIRKSGRNLLGGLDSILNRAFFTKNVGREVPVGIAMGSVVFGLTVVVNFLIITFTGGYSEVYGENTRHLNYSFPLAGVFFSMLFYALYEEIIFRKFFVTYMRNITSSWFWGIFISAGAYALFNIFFSSFFQFWPRYYALIPYFTIGLVQGYVFWRYGLLASMTSGMFFVSMDIVRYWLESGNPAYTVPAYITVVFWIAVTLVSLYSLVKGRYFQYSRSSEPLHIKRIKERTRMQKELEIARRVQLGLLPKERPAMEGFDVAGICVPANEVGGDYFDFIQLQDGKLGLAIADVSGKGVPAAIYMTLTKGILQSHAESDLSPKTVLSKVNSLMYRTIERSWFVSMFYAVLDPQTRKMRFARAGHNPAFVINQNREKPQLLQTAGIGLGLEMGEIFNRTLAEGELQLSPGDTLVFYTDGFTEAIDEQGKEYGEERLLDFIQANDNGGGAAGILEKTVNEIRLFCGNAEQHDDMTMVVLKVL